MNRTGLLCSLLFSVQIGLFVRNAPNTDFTFRSLTLRFSEVFFLVMLINEQD